MEPDAVIEDEDDIDPSSPPHVETTNEWMDRIDAKWEVEHLQL